MEMTTRKTKWILTTSLIEIPTSIDMLLLTLRNLVHLMKNTNDDEVY